MARLAGKYSPQIVVQIRRPFECILRALAVIVLAQSDANLGKGLDLLAHAVARTRAGNLVQKFVDVLKLSQRRPTAIAPAPIRTRLQPHSERLCEIFRRMRLRV